MAGVRGPTLVRVPRPRAAERAQSFEFTTYQLIPQGGCADRLCRWNAPVPMCLCPPQSGR